MLTSDLVILLSSAVLCLAIIPVWVLTVIEHRRPPIRGRLEEIIAAAARRKNGPCP